MKSDFDLINRIEAYLRGELSPQEEADFEKIRAEDSTIDLKVVEHQSFMNQISEYGMQKQLLSNMESILKAL